MLHFFCVYIIQQLCCYLQCKPKTNCLIKLEIRGINRFIPFVTLIISYYATFVGNELHHTIFHGNKRLNKEIRNEEVALKVFKLGHNNIHSLPPDCFEYLTNLEVLELNNNPLLVIDQNTEISLGYLTKLQSLDLGYTSISSFPGNMFSQLSNVRTLYLNGNQFQNIPTEIRAMPLTHLNMNANPIDHLDNESFVGLDRLQQLVISGMPNLTDIGSGTFVPLKTLITLHMAHNPTLSNIHFDAFRDHMTNQLSLRQLTIRDNNLSSVDSKLYHWKKLDSFDAKSNPWTCDCRLSWLASYINETFAHNTPEMLLYYRCNEPKDLYGTLVSQLNEHIGCDEFDQTPINHSHGHVTRLRHFIIVIGLVISIFVFGTIINICCREIKKILKPRIHVPSRFSTGVKYKPADFEENTDTFEVFATVKNNNTMIHGRSPIVINNTD